MPSSTLDDNIRTAIQTQKEALGCPRARDNRARLQVRHGCAGGEIRASVRSLRHALRGPQRNHGHARQAAVVSANIVQAIAFGTVNDPSLRACTLLGRGLEGVI